jgi:hypothetical protein
MKTTTQITSQAIAIAEQQISSNGIANSLMMPGPDDPSDLPHRNVQRLRA